MVTMPTAIAGKCIGCHSSILSRTSIRARRL